MRRLIMKDMHPVAYESQNASREHKAPLIYSGASEIKRVCSSMNPALSQQDQCFSHITQDLIQARTEPWIVFSLVGVRFVKE